VRRSLASPLLAAALLAIGSSQALPAAVAGGGANARAALLRRSDLGGGWSVAAGPARHVPPLTCPRFHPSTRGLTATSSAASPSFERSVGGPFVSQTAYAYANAAQEQQAWRVLARAKLIECVAASVAGASGDGVSFTVIAKGTLTLPRLRTRALGFSVTATATSSEVPTTVYLDAVLLGGAGTISELTVSSFGRHESASLATRLAGLIARRIDGS
jgi:hypothetical protein